MNKSVLAKPDNEFKFYFGRLGCNFYEITLLLPILFDWSYKRYKRNETS